MSNRQRQLLIRGTVLAVLIVLIFVLSRYAPQPFHALLPLVDEFDYLGEIYSSTEKMKRWLVSLGSYSSAVFILMQAFQVVSAPIPGELTGVVGGYVYGKTFGLVLSTLGLTLGSWIAFELASIFGRPFVERLVRPDLLKKFDFVTTNTGVMICFLLFLVPGFPKDYLCYVLGLSRMGLGTFLVVSTIGRIPGTYLLTVQGSSLREQEYVTAIILTALSIIFFLLAYLYRNRLVHWIKAQKEG